VIVSAVIIALIVYTLTAQRPLDRHPNSSARRTAIIASSFNRRCRWNIRARRGAGARPRSPYFPVIVLDPECRHRVHHGGAFAASTLGIRVASRDPAGTLSGG
jgi:hypothetical protein